MNCLTKSFLAVEYCSMKRFYFLIVFVLLAGFAQAQKIEPKPNPPKAVNDFAHLLEPFQVDALEQKLRAYNDSTSSAIVIITVPNLDGYDIAEVALKYLRDWGIGTAAKSNGVVIMVAKEERKARIETGYGMEGVLPDITAKHIIDDEMIPNFKNNDYYRGLDRAVDAVILAAAGEYKADTKKDKSGGGAGIVFLIIFIIILVVFLSRGGGGDGGGTYMSRKGSRSFLDALPWFLMGNMLGGGGNRGGGGFGGGGFGGGGFGGFGGGSGGGGGASGGW